MTNYKQHHPRQKQNLKTSHTFFIQCPDCKGIGGFDSSIPMENEWTWDYCKRCNGSGKIKLKNNYD